MRRGAIVDSGESFVRTGAMQKMCNKNYWVQLNWVRREKLGYPSPASPCTFYIPAPKSQGLLRTRRAPCYQHHRDEMNNPALEPLCGWTLSPHVMNHQAQDVKPRGSWFTSPAAKVLSEAFVGVFYRLYAQAEWIMYALDLSSSYRLDCSFG